MFKNPFSFEGRIGRREYGITILIYIISIVMRGVLAAGGGQSGAIVSLLLLVPMMWLLWAQGAKRCHDINTSGWYQLIPFYPFVLLFTATVHGPNKYTGDNATPTMTGDDVPLDYMEIQEAKNEEGAG